MSVLYAAGLFGLAAQVGCIVPWPTELEEDDPVVSNAPPVVVSAAPSPDFDFPGPILVDRADLRFVTLTMVDNDIADVLHIRVFRDYTTVANTLYDQATIEPSGSEVRTRELSLSTWCLGLPDTDNSRHIVEVMIADRPYQGSGDPPFRALPDSAGWSIRSWMMICNPPEDT